MPTVTSEPVVCTDALPCPFCGELPTIRPWHGGKPTKRLIACENDGEELPNGRYVGGCTVRPGITGETRREALAYWNTRA